MQSILESLERKALQLPEGQRITLAHKIMQSTEPCPDSGVAHWWEEEIVRRIELLDSGAAGRHDVSEVFRDLDKRLGK
jgi:hypothetical protein